LVIGTSQRRVHAPCLLKLFPSAVHPLVPGGGTGSALRANPAAKARISFRGCGGILIQAKHKPTDRKKK